jgi:hypothetical protein
VFALLYSASSGKLSRRRALVHQQITQKKLTVQVLTGFFFHWQIVTDSYGLINLASV